MRSPRLDDNGQGYLGTWRRHLRPAPGAHLSVRLTWQSWFWHNACRTALPRACKAFGSFVSVCCAMLRGRRRLGALVPARVTPRRAVSWRDGRLNRCHSKGMWAAMCLRPINGCRAALLHQRANLLVRVTGCRRLADRRTRLVPANHLQSASSSYAVLKAGHEQLARAWLLTR